MIVNKNDLEKALEIAQTVPTVAQTSEAEFTREGIHARVDALISHRNMILQLMTDYKADIPNDSQNAIQSVVDALEHAIVTERLEYINAR